MWVDNLWRLQNFITAHKIVILKEKKTSYEKHFISEFYGLVMLALDLLSKSLKV